MRPHLHVIAIALVAVGCAPPTSQWTPVEAPKENRVTFVRLAHDVRFRAGEDRLIGTEAQRLAAFLQRESVGYGDQVSVLAADSPAGRRQQEAVVSALRRSGVRALPAGPAEGMDAAGNTVRIVVGRHVVTPPACPNWTRPPTDDYANHVASNFGCANAYNLGLMVADPGDLLAGRAPGPADGEAATLAIQRYRAGKITPLQSDTQATPAIGVIGLGGSGGGN